MACLTHWCRDCDHEWFNNKQGECCPECNSSNIKTSFDEPKEDHSDDCDDGGYEHDENEWSEE